MSSGKSVGTCIEVIEGSINTDDIWCGCDSFNSAN
jgi:hypothetical protein